MNTQFMLMAQYNGKAIIPLEEVQRDFFPHLKMAQFQAKLLKGDILIPVVRLDPGSQKSAKGVLLTDLANLLEEQNQLLRGRRDELPRVNNDLIEINRRQTAELVQRNKELAWRRE